MTCPHPPLPTPDCFIANAKWIKFARDLSTLLEFWNNYFLGLLITAALFCYPIYYSAFIIIGSFLLPLILFGLAVLQLHLLNTKIKCTGFNNSKLSSFSTWN